MSSNPANQACPDILQYQRLAWGQLTDVQKETLLTHLEDCDSCAHKLNALPEQDTLVGFVRQAQTLSERGSEETIARLIDRLSKLRPSADLAVRPVVTGIKPQAVAKAAGMVENTVDDRPADAKEDESYDFLAAPQSSDELGRLGTYRVLQVLGAGGMGVVFRAEDPQLARVVALKAMRPVLATSASARQRFLREARAAAAIKHDHIVTIYQVGEERGVPFMAMELLEGEPLDARLQRQGKLPVAEVLRIGRETALGMAAAHKRGLVHRDIKPANIWLEAETSRVKILDFGLARSDGAGGEAVPLTQQGMIVGTPGYMAPEQAQGKNVDQRCDLFSLGCVLYRLSTGTAPFKGADTISTLMAVATENPRPPHELEPSLPRSLSDLIMKLLAKEAEDRPASAQAVAEALEHIAREPVAAAKPRPRRRRWLSAAVAVAVVAVIAVGAAAIFHITLQGQAKQRSIATFAITDKPISRDGVTVDQGGWKVEARQNRTARFFEVANPGVDDGIVTYRARMKCDKIEGKAYLEMWCRLPGKGEFFSKGFHNALSGTSDWASYEIPFRLEQGQKPDQIKLNVTVEGKGTVWLKDVELLFTPFKAEALGEFVIETDDPDVAVMLDQKGGIIIHDTKADRKFTVKPGKLVDLPTGEYEVEVTDESAGLVFNARTFTIKRGDKFVLKAQFHAKKEPIDAKKPVSEKDEERIQGTWTAVSGEVMGKPLPELILPGITASFTGETMRIGMPTGFKGEGTFSLDPSKNPKRITVIANQAENFKGMQGIYSLDGDTLKICMGDPKDGLPGDFASKVDKPTIMLIVLKRDKGSKPEAAAPPRYKNGLGMEFAVIPRGKAWLGGGTPWSAPASAGGPGTQEVEYKEDFYLGVYEVTQEEWEKITALNPSHFSRKGAGKDAVKDVSDADLKRFPVERVTWNDAQLFIKRLNERDSQAGWVYRLPTQAEWEYACRGGPVDKFDSAFDFYFDKPIKQLLPALANYKDLNRTCKVGSYPPNRLGLYDMHGNVSEWCEDVRPKVNAATECEHRGGNWSGGPEWCRANAVFGTGRELPFDRVGLRVARVRVDTAPDRRAAEWVLSIGGTIGITENGKEREIKAGADLPRGAYELTFVDLNHNPKVSDAGLAHFQDCKNLTSIALHFSPVSDAGLAHFKNCKNLTKLSLAGTHVSDAGLVHLKDHKNLTLLDLNHNLKVSDAGVDELAGCSKLGALKLRNTKVTETGVKKLVAALPLCQIDWNSPVDRRAAEWVLSIGGTIRVDDNERNLKAATELPREPFRLTGVGLQANPLVDDAGLANFKDCKNLTHLGLDLNKQVGDASLAHFKDCRNLTHVGLDGTQVGDAGLAHLKDCTNLRDINLTITKVTDAGLAHLKDCKNLGILNLHATKVSGAGLAHLQGTKNPLHINLFHAQVNDAGLALAQLQVLNVARLELSGTQVGDGGLVHLKQCKTLTALGLRETKVTDAGIEELNKALPKCNISWNGGAIEGNQFINTLGMEFALIPKGKAWLGGMGGKVGNKEVEIPRDFYLGVYEVTQEEWQKVMSINPSGFSRAGKEKDALKDITDADLKRFPVESVSWDDCQEFVTRLNEKVKDSGWVYRLPTQVEWEYACRGGPLTPKADSGFDYYFDRPTNTLLPDRANFNNILKRTCKVGSYLPNRLGLYDMHGNVAEWCHDGMAEDDGAPRRLTRGGSARHPAAYCRAVFIVRSQSFARFDDVGLRLARVPVEAPPK